MAEVVLKQKIAEDTFLLTIKEPQLAKHARAGQFLNIRADKKDKAKPFLIAGSNAKNISVIFRAAENKQLTNLRKGMSLHQVRGPLGNALPVAEMGTVCIVCDHDGVGAGLYFAEAYANAKNRIFFIASYRSEKHIFWQDRVEAVAHKHVIIDEKHDNIGNRIVREVHNLIRRKNIAMLISCCDLKTMEELANITKLRTTHLAILTPIVFDGIGICGSCRLEVDGETRMACIDGPAMDAHKINWQVLNNRRCNFLEGCTRRCNK